MVFSGLFCLSVFFLDDFAFLAAGLGAHAYRATESDQSDGIRQNHELVEHVCKLPDQVVGKQRSGE